MHEKACGDSCLVLI